MRLAEPFHRAGEHVAIELPGARAVFTTRRGGSSTGPYASLNLGRFTDDRRACVEHNRRLLELQLGVRFAYGRQVHGTCVRRVVEVPPEPPGPGPADGQATALPGVAPLVLTADCLPIAIAGEGAVAMLHAGWRGLEAGVVAAGVAALRELGARGSLTAAIGPGAGPCCYEVGDEVRAAFAAFGDRVREGRRLNLKAIASTALEQAGVGEVHDAGLCTICSPSLFYSHRRDRGVTGRQAGIAWLCGP
ncbi:MAG: polyphenol oxidase family protein [Solirubrobacteraceae bacterium]|jgi:polyphenol oxidase